MQIQAHSAPDDLVVRCNPGALPRMWDRQVIFISNLLSLFFGNDRETGVLRDQIGTLETYGGRLIPLLGLLFQNSHRNLVVLEQEPNPDLLEYFRANLDLSLPDVAVLPHDDYLALAESDGADRHPTLAAFLETLESHPAQWLDGFVTDEPLIQLARKLSRQTICGLEASRRGNNKLLLHQHLAESGLPVFDTCIVDTAEEVPEALATLRDQGYAKAAVKAQIGASGIGLIQVPTDHQEPVPDYLFYEGPCLVQGWLDTTWPDVESIRSPSVQLFLNDDSLSLYDLTEQILSTDSIHEGNIAPPPWLDRDDQTRDILLTQAEVAGRWLHRQGYRGTASVDFHVAQKRDSTEVRVCEINARVTGATYPSILARHFLPGGVWLMRNLKLAEPIPASRLLHILQANRILFHPGQTPSIIPINFNLDRQGNVIKGQFLCLGHQAEEPWCLLDKAQHVLPVEREFDRD